MTASAQSAKFAQTVFDGMNLLGAYAVPGAFEADSDNMLNQTFKQESQRYVTELKAAIEGSAMVKAIPKLERFDTLLMSWEPTSPPPPELVTAARDCLIAMGIPEPADGWDSIALQDG